MERGVDKLNKAVIGKAGSKEIGINIEKLMTTRLLIQANSGGGKSYLIRKLLEETHGKVQQIVLDLEGEFATMREQYDYVLVGSDGDIPADVSSAELLARKLLETKASAIIDLYELSPSNRILYVKKFLDAMTNAPKELWHPVLVVIDEAHMFCPEKAKSESANSVINLATRGRKRGYCAVLATQRISKLNKDTAAECNNKLIGRAMQDIDRKRSAEELGFTSKEQILSLRKLKAGEFYAFGPAISDETVLLKVGKTKTSHEQQGTGVVKLAPAKDTIKLILSKLKDLPQKAKEERFEKADLQREIRELKLQLKKAGTQKYSKVPAEKNKNDILNARKQGYSEAKKHYDQQFNKMRQNQRSIKHSANLIESNAKKIMAAVIESSKISIFDQKDFYECQYKSVPQINKEYGIGKNSSSLVATKLSPITSSTKPSIKESIKESANKWVLGDEKIGPGAMKMLKAAAMFYPNPITKARMGAIAVLSYKSGSFSTYLSNLKRNELLEGNGKEFTITEKGLEVAGDVDQIPTDPNALVDLWVGVVKGGAGRMLKALAEVYPGELSREELGEAAEMSSTSGSFTTYISTLKRNGLIKVDGKTVKASESLFLEAL